MAGLRKMLPLSLAACSVKSVCDQHVVEPDFDRARKSADVLTRIFKEQRAVPGLTIAVAVNGQIVWRAGYGFSDVENLISCSCDSVMRIGSISKSITAAIVAKLVENGLLDLDAPVQQYVPTFPVKYLNGDKVVITTRHLLSHMSGVRHYTKREHIHDASNKKCTCGGTLNKKEFDHDEYYIREEFGSVAAALKLFQDDQLIHKPGAKFLYTTHGWTLVSAVGEGASKVTFERLLRDLCHEIGMHQTSFDRNQPLIALRSQFYKRNDHSQLVNTMEVNNSYKWAGGGILSNVEDLVRFGIKMNEAFSGNGSDPILKKESVRMMWTPVDGSEQAKNGSSYGMGWWIRARKRIFGCDGHLVVSHAGGSVGASSLLYINNGNGKDHPNIVVAILTNLQECGGLNDFADRVCLIFNTLE